MIKTVYRLLRVQQWVKNFLVFAALIFAQQYTNPTAIVSAVVAFFALSFIASTIYILNDLLDLEWDRKHPTKKNRPIASGKIKPPVAVIIALALTTVGFGLAWQLNFKTIVVLAVYFITMILYSVVLKRVALLDTMIIAGGMTLRAVLGGEAIDVSISHWLLVCTFFIALLLALIKRRQEIARVSESGIATRSNLDGSPSVETIDNWISTLSAVTILAYTLYTVDPTTVARFGSNRLLITVPIVVYAIFRYIYRARQNSHGEDPTDSLLSDRGMIATVALWLFTVLLLLSTKPG